MKAVLAFALLATIASACTSQPPSAAVHTATPTPFFGPSPQPSQSTEPSPSAEPTPVPTSQSAPKVSCVQGRIPTSEALIGGTNGTFLFDVADPIHPRAVCRFENTFAH